MKKLIIIVLIGLVMGCNQDLPIDGLPGTNNDLASVDYKNKTYLINDAKEFLGSQSIVFSNDIDDKTYLFDSKLDLIDFAQEKFGLKVVEVLKKHFDSKKPEYGNSSLKESTPNSKVQTTYDDFDLELYNNECDGSPYLPFQIYSLNTGAYPSANIPSTHSLTGFFTLSIGVRVPSGGSMVVETFGLAWPGESCAYSLNLYTQTSSKICVDSYFPFCDLFHRYGRPIGGINYTCSL